MNYSSTHSVYMWAGEESKLLRVFETGDIECYQRVLTDGAVVTARMLPDSETRRLWNRFGSRSRLICEARAGELMLRRRRYEDIEAWTLLVAGSLARLLAHGIFYMIQATFENLSSAFGTKVRVRLFFKKKESVGVLVLDLGSEYRNRGE